MAEPDSEEFRREVFLALVEAQDGGASVPESRSRVAASFGITERAVLDIEREGADKEWPPLG
jgi:hypothetical protein